MAEGGNAMTLPDIPELRESLVDVTFAQRQAEEYRPCTTRPMTPPERVTYPVQHPTAAEIEDGIKRGLTLEEICEETGGDYHKGWHVARRNNLIERLNNICRRRGIRMESPPLKKPSPTRAQQMASPDYLRQEASA
jgi:hypothetical protein